MKNNLSILIQALGFFLFIAIFIASLVLAAWLDKNYFSLLNNFLFFYA